MLETYDAVLQPNGYVGFRDTKPPVVFQPTEVLVTFRQPLAPLHGTQPGDPAAFLKHLRDNPVPKHLCRSPEQMDRDIQEERNSWD